MAALEEDLQSKTSCFTFANMGKNPPKQVVL
jgi:hypothetical protein